MPALISAVGVELAEEGIAIGSPGTVGLGLAVGAATYFLADGLVARRAQSGGANGGSGKGEGSGKSLALGSFLDGIPEQLVLGIGLAGGEPVSVALLVAIFVSNLPEGIGASVDMKASGMPRRGNCLSLSRSMHARQRYRLRYRRLDLHRPSSRRQRFCCRRPAGDVIDSMIPEARSKAGRTAGLIAVLGFAVATALSNV